MNKKIITSIIAGACSFGILSSCTDLGENVYSKQSTNEFGKTQKEIYGLMGSAYNSLKYFWPNNFLYLSECVGTSAVTTTRVGGDWYDGGQYRELYGHTWTAQTKVIRDSWSDATKALGNCNVTIYHLQESKVLTEEEKTIAISEMRGVRAFWQYVLVDYWGWVPLIKEYEEGEKTLPSQTTRQENFEWIISELETILPYLPEPKDNYGKFTTGAAYALLAKMYLNAEAWGIQGIANPYEKCIEYCDKIFDLNYYILEPDWTANFNVNNHNSREAILAACFSSQNSDIKNEMHKRTLHYNDNQAVGGTYSTWNGICFQPGFVRLFDENDPRYDLSFRIGQMYHYETGDIIKTAYGDPLNYSIDIKFVDGEARKPFGEVVQEAGARCQKWEYTADLTDAMDNDFHIFRLADIYLMKAEALLRSGGSVSVATSLVNAVRERAYNNSAIPIEPSTYLLSTVTLEDILMERRFELTWENYSRQDDIRFGKFTDAYWPECGVERETGEHLKILPIPEEAWQRNQNLKQNPVYSGFSSN